MKKAADADGVVRFTLDDRKHDWAEVCNRLAVSMGYKIVDDPAAWQRVITLRAKRAEQEKIDARRAAR